MSLEHNSSRHRQQQGSQTRPARCAACVELHVFLATSVSLLALAVAVFLAIAPVASAEDNLPPGVPVPAWAVGKHVHFYPTRRRQAEVLASEESQQGLSPQMASPAAASPYCFNADKLCYGGGPVQHEPQLYVIFWGEGFEQGPPASEELTTLRDFYLGLEENKGEPGQKSWQGILSQYFDNEGPGSIRAKVKVIFDKPSIPGTIENAQVEDVIGELVQSEREKGVEPSPEAQYIVLPQPGTNYSNYHEMKKSCGFHGVDGEGYSYTVIPWAEDVECEDEEGAIAETNGAAAHEFAESATDPSVAEPGKNYTSLTGWAQEAKGEVEVADLCEFEPHATEKPKNDFWWAVKLWDDKGGNKCNIEDPPYSPPPAPSATTEAASGIKGTEATVTGTVDPNGPAARYYFEYGTTTAYGKDSPGAPGENAGYGATGIPVKTQLAGLEPGVTYHYRLVASTWAGTTDGKDQTFTTSPWALRTVARPAGAEFTALEGVSCTSSANCIAVGNYAVGKYDPPEGVSLTLAEHWNGTTWAVQSTPNPTGKTATESFLNAVSCPSTVDCTAVGGYFESDDGPGFERSIAEHWNGSTWQLQTLVEPKGATEMQMLSVSCSAAEACTAVGNYDKGEEGAFSLTERWNGKAWKIEKNAEAKAGLQSVSCMAAKACFAVGGGIAVGHYDVEQWNGTTWKSAPSIEAGAPSAVSCWSSNGCTATGSKERTGAIAEAWNGTSWKAQVVPNPMNANKQSEASLTSVSCSSSSACMGTGQYHDEAEETLALAERWSGSAWEAEMTPSLGGAYGKLDGVSCWAATGCMAVGSVRATDSEASPATAIAEEAQFQSGS